MSRLRYNRAAAVSHLKARCDRLGAFIEHQGPLRLRVASGENLFEALARSIVYQQLSGKAAGTIHGRFCALFPEGRPDPKRVAGLSVEALRSAGLSYAKARAVRDLAEKSLDGTLVPLRKTARMSDEELIQNFCQVKGIGPWTAQMLLMFTLGRPDVMPALDLGVQKGVQAVYGLEETPPPEQVLELTVHLAPYRSAASWYFWRAADTVLMT